MKGRDACTVLYVFFFFLFFFGLTMFSNAPDAKFIRAPVPGDTTGWMFSSSCWNKGKPQHDAVHLQRQVGHSRAISVTTFFSRRLKIEMPLVSLLP